MGFFPLHIRVSRKGEQRDGGCDSRVWCVESTAWAEFSILKLPYLAIHSRSCEYIFQWGILDSVPLCIVWVMIVALLLKKCICVTEVWFFFSVCVLDMTGFFGRQIETFVIYKTHQKGLSQLCQNIEHSRSAAHFSRPVCCQSWYVESCSWDPATSPSHKQGSHRR